MSIRHPLTTRALRLHCRSGVAVGPRAAKFSHTLLDEIPRLRRLRPAINASLDRVAAHDDQPRAQLGPKPAGRDQTDREIGQQAATDLGSKSDKQNQIRLQSAQVANSARWDW